MQKPTPMESYTHAVAEEQAAWAAVRGRFPGTAAYDPEVWARWKAAVEATGDARWKFIYSLAPRPRPDPGQ